MAGEILHRAVQFPRDYCDPIPHFWDKIRESAQGASVGERAQAVHSWAVANIEKFYGHHKLGENNNPIAPSTGWYGRWNNKSSWEFLGFIPSILDRALRESGFNEPKAIRAEWRNREWLNCRSGGDTKSERLNGKQVELICIKRASLNCLDEQTEGVPARANNVFDLRWFDATWDSVAPMTEAKLNALPELERHAILSEYNGWGYDYTRGCCRREPIVDELESGSGAKTPFITFPKVFDPDSEVCSEGKFLTKWLTVAPLPTPFVTSVSWKMFCYGAQNFGKQFRIRDENTIEEIW
jgi:hypothetical protein